MARSHLLLGDAMRAVTVHGTARACEVQREDCPGAPEWRRGEKRRWCSRTLLRQTPSACPGVDQPQAMATGCRDHWSSGRDTRRDPHDGASVVPACHTCPKTG